MTSSQVKKIANIDRGIINKCIVMGSKNDKRPKLTDLSTLSNFMTSLTARLGGKCWQVKFPPPSTPASAKGALPDPYTHKRFFNLREEGEKFQGIFQDNSLFRVTFEGSQISLVWSISYVYTSNLTLLTGHGLCVMGFDVCHGKTDYNGASKPSRVALTSTKWVFIEFSTPVRSDSSQGFHIHTV